MHHHHHHRTPVPFKGWLFLYFTLIGGITWAYVAALWLGILVSVVVAVIVVLGITATVSARRETRRRAMPDDGRDTGWKSEHVPASAEYKAAHPEGPRDWEPVS